MATASLKERERPDMSCPLCYQDYETPMLLVCNHCICNNCVQHLQKRGSLKCPECKQEMKVSDIKVDQELKGAMDMYNSVFSSAQGLFSMTKGILCVECKEKLYKWRCKDCDKKFCDGCRAGHVAMTAAKGRKHTLVSTKGMSEDDVASFVARAEECEKMIDECTSQNDAALAKHVSEIEAEKTATLEFLRRTQQQIVDMINAYFASIDAAYVDATPEEMDILNNQLSALRDDPNDPISTLKELKSFSDILLEEGNPDGVSIEAFHKIKKMHVEQLEKFKEYYGKPFALPGRIGDETRRFSNMNRAKTILESITNYDVDGTIAAQRGLNQGEALPTLEEIVEITGISKQDIYDILEMYNIELICADSVITAVKEKDDETVEQTGSDDSDVIEDDDDDVTCVAGASAAGDGSVRPKTSQSKKDISATATSRDDEPTTMNQSNQSSSAPRDEETITNNSKKEKETSPSDQETKTSRKIVENGDESLSNHTQGEQICDNATDKVDSCENLFEDTDSTGQRSYQEKKLAAGMEHLNLGEVQDE